MDDIHCDAELHRTGADLVMGYETTEEAEEARKVLLNSATHI